MRLLPRLIEAESRGGNGDIKKALYPFPACHPAPGPTLAAAHQPRASAQLPRDGAFAVLVEAVLDQCRDGVESFAGLPAGGLDQDG